MENIWPWLIIFAVLAVAVGPAMALLPSRKDRRLAALRAEARRLGLQVQLLPVRWLDAPADALVTAGGRKRTPMHASVCYALPVAQRLQGMAPWRLLRGREGWLPDREIGGDGERALPPGLIARLAPLCGRLPQDTVAIDFTGQTLGCCWLERFPADAGTAADVKAALLRLLAEVSAIAVGETRDEAGGVAGQSGACLSRLGRQES